MVFVELRARHPRGVIARLSPYTSYYWSNEPREDQPPFPPHPLRRGEAVIKLGGVEDSDDTVSLAEGSNVITVEVTAEDGVSHS